MSKIGKKPIKIPQGVEIRIEDSKIFAKGVKGEGTLKFSSRIKVEKEDNLLKIRSKNDKYEKQDLALWGTTRSLINNLIIGVNEGFERKLEIHGTGYKASLSGSKLVLNIGFSHPVELEVPPDLEVKIDKNLIIIKGINKERVFQFAAQIRNIKKPDPYKGKGIRYVGEIIRKKAGKSAVKIE